MITQSKWNVKKGIITFKPVDHKERFPAFTKVRVIRGTLYGYVGKQRMQIGTIEHAGTHIIEFDHRSITVHIK